jgi:hypothetical protein
VAGITQADVGHIQTPEKYPYASPNTTTLAMSLRAITEMMRALHVTVDAMVKFNAPAYAAIIPAVQRPITQAAFMITS